VAGETDAIMASYRANVTSAMLARNTPQDEVFAIQYVVNPPDQAPADILSAVGIDGSGKAGAPGSRGGKGHATASLTVRFLGKASYEVTGRTTVRGFQYAAALPAYLSRLVGHNRVALGDETVDEVAEQVVADEVDAAGASMRAAGAARAAEVGRKAVPYLARNAAAVRGGQEGGGGAAGRAAGWRGMGGHASGDLAAAVGEGGGMRFIGGTGEAFVAGGGSAGAGGR
jgi:hypothetical protein